MRSVDTWPMLFWSSSSVQLLKVAASGHSPCSRVHSLLISVTPFSSQFHRANVPGKPSSDAAELGLSVEQSERAELLREGALSPTIGVLLEGAAEVEDLRGELPALAEQEVDDVRGEASG
jgi:hypothetical protein